MPKLAGIKKIIFFSLIFIVAIGFSVWQFYKYKIADKSIHKAVTQKSKGLYDIHYSNLSIDEINGSLSVDSVIINADTSVYNKMQPDIKPSILVNLFIPNLKVLHVATPKALLTKEISGEEVRIDNPVIEINVTDFLKDSSGYSPGKEIYKQILSGLKSIQIKRVSIYHAKLIIKDLLTQNQEFEAKDISISLNDLSIDSLTEKDSSRILFSKNIDLACKEIILEAKSKKYKTYFKGIEYASVNNSFSMRSLRVVPTLSEVEFAKASRVQKDRYDFIFENIRITNIDRQKLWRKMIEADELSIQKSSFKIYRDLSYLQDSTQKLTGNFPQQQLMRLPVKLALKKIILPHSFIEYKEKNAKSHKSGKVQFYEVNATLTNVTNINSLIVNNNICAVNFKSKFLNKTSITAKLNLFLKDKEGKFSIEGHMDSMDATTLNSLTEPMALIKLKNGNINSLDFDFVGDNDQTNGQLKILYDGVKIQALKMDESDTTYNKKILSSLILNHLIKKSNPRNDKMKTVQVHYERVGHKSIFNMIWKPILQGTKETMGIK